MSQLPDLPDVAVHMIRPTMAALPGWSLPAGYRLRAYHAGDIETWLALHLDAEPLFRVSREHFDDSFAAHPEALVDRMFFVQSIGGEDTGGEDTGGEDVGSVTAWWEDDWQGRGAWGQVHWVVVATAHQRRGLAKPMTAHALRRIAQEHSRAMLGTNSQRPWAIKVYLDCGFVPDPAERKLESVVSAWASLQQILQHHAIAQWLLAGDPNGER